MVTRRAVAWTATVLLGSGGLAVAGSKAVSGRPHLVLRASPRIALPPVSVLLAAELKGGEAVEEFYCPGREWDWGDGSLSVEEGDCPPFQAGMELQRFFSARHSYGGPGLYEVKLTLRRAGQAVAVARVPILLFGSEATSPD